MPSQEIDISWQVLRRIVQQWAGESAELAEVKPLAGGCINNTLTVATRNGERAVLKISPHRVNLAHEQEAYQINLLRDIGLPVPRIHGWSVGSLDEPHSYMLMEYVEGIDLARARQTCGEKEFADLQAHLAELVLLLHGHTAPAYMRLANGDAREYTSWIDFFHAVYDPIWEETQKSGLLPAKVRKQVAKVHEKLPRLLQHEDVPRLTHWDIWSGNVLARPDEHGRWRVAALIDPNCKYAHAEGEIAYLELFNTVTPDFLKTYQKHHRLPPEYARFRRPVYQLYHLMNHVRLFGQEYLKPFLGAVERAARAV